MYSNSELTSFLTSSELFVKFGGNSEHIRVELHDTPGIEFTSQR